MFRETLIISSPRRKSGSRLLISLDSGFRRNDSTMLEEVKAVATREKGEPVKGVEAAKVEIIELKKPKASTVKKAPVKKAQPEKKGVATTGKASRVGVTQAD